MILNMIWHVLQKVVECYFVPLHRLSYIYRPIYSRFYQPEENPTVGQVSEKDIQCFL